MVLFCFLSPAVGQRFVFLPSVGVTGFEPVTLRLSSACSNQLSYTPGSGAGGAPARFQVQKFRSFKLSALPQACKP